MSKSASSSKITRKIKKVCKEIDDLDIPDVAKEAMKCAAITCIYKNENQTNLSSDEVIAPRGTFMDILNEENQD